MFRLYAIKNQMTVWHRETVTSGSVSAYRVRFEFSGDWKDLDRTAVFRCGDVSVPVLLDENGTCVIPREVLQNPGHRLEAGVYGTRGGEIVLPTVWANLGTVLTGVDAPEEGEVRPPSGETGGVSDHRLLTGRDASGQHPIQSISGLEEELKRIPAPAEALTNEDLEEILK